MITNRIPPGDRALYAKIFRVALPIALQSVISTSLSLVDNLIVGRLLDETALSTVGLSTQIYFIFWMLLFGFTGGSITYMAQFYGKGDMASLRRVCGIAIAVCFSVGVIFFAACFFFPRAILGIFTDIPEVMELGTPLVRWGSFVFLTWSVTVPLTAALKSTQQTRIPMVISIIALSFSTGLTFLLVSGAFGFPRLGVMGVAVGIVSSRALELALYLIVIFPMRNILAAPVREFFSWNRDLFDRVVRNALPTTVNETMWGLGVSMYSAAYGRLDVISFAAFQAGYTIMNIFAVACFSIGETMLILVGERLGANDISGAWHAASRILRVVAIAGLAAGALLLLVSPLIVSLFDFSDAGAMYTRRILYVFSAFVVFKALGGAFVVGVLRAGGDTRFAMLAELCTIWLYAVPSAFFFALYLRWPIYLAVMMTQLEEVIKCIIMYRRYRSGKWVRDLVKDIRE
jgi:putative MATE family efflux protein